MGAGQGKGYSSAELTQHNLDKTLLLEQTISQQHGQAMFLGNVQVCARAPWLASR